MRYLALVADYDGTVATHGEISESVAQAMERLRVSGRRIVLVTGRRLDDLLAICSCARLFDLVVAENGAIVYDPASREEIRLGNPPSKLLLKSLRARGVEPLEVGQVVVGAPGVHRNAVHDVVWELGLEAQVIANRGALMILPAGINKASGLAYALRKLGLSRHEIVGVGDAENDHSFLAMCECAVAVANALPAVKARAAFVTRSQNGAGVAELIEELIADDLARVQGALEHNLVALGVGADGTPVRFSPYGYTVLVAGPSGSGKSTLAAGFIERLIEKHYQVCIIDPEGDYGTLRHIAAIGNQWRAPGVGEVMSILGDPAINVGVNLLGLGLEDRPEFLAQLIPNLQALRMRTGRPHWIVVDEAHHMVPATWGHTGAVLPKRLGEVLLVTVHPEHIAADVLASVDIVVAVGGSQRETLARFATATGRSLPWPEDREPVSGEVMVWLVGDGKDPFPMRPYPGRTERIRHRRKYAEGDLRWHSFYFRGPRGRHNLKAQNLAVFCQMAQGIDEETWMYHLRRGDYSRWFRDAVRDALLAEEAARVEQRTDLSPQQTREMICELIDARYTLPA